jgi:flagellin
MGLMVQNNIASLNAQHQLSRTTGALGTSLERLSSGLRINKAADDPAGLVISEQQRAQIVGLSQAIENSERGVTLVQTAEGALNEINSILLKLRELALDSANTGANDSNAMAANQNEVDNAIETVNRIANYTQFGTKKLLDGSAGMTGTMDDADVTFVRATSAASAGTYAINVSQVAERARVTAASAQSANTATKETLTVNGVTITIDSGLSRSQVQSRINQFTGQTGVTAQDSGASTSTLLYGGWGDDYTVTAQSNVSAATTSSGVGTTQLSNTGTDVDGTIGTYAADGVGRYLSGDSTAAATGITVLIDAASDGLSTETGAQGTLTLTDNSLQFQVGGNANQTKTLAIQKLQASALGLGVTSNQFASLSEIQVTTAAKSSDAIDIIDEAITDVATLRGELGAFQTNVLEANISGLQVSLENLQQADSVVRDTDFAKEVAEMTKQQILLQAGTSVLSTANMIPQVVLSLLQ